MGGRLLGSNADLVDGIERMVEDSVCYPIVVNERICKCGGIISFVPTESDMVGEEANVGRWQAYRLRYRMDGVK